MGKRICGTSGNRKISWGVVFIAAICIVAAGAVIYIAAAGFITYQRGDAIPEATADKDWNIVKQEGFPCIVVDEERNIVGTKRGNLFTKIYLDYYAVVDINEFVPYQIQAGAFSDCPNLKTLIVPAQVDVLTYVDYVDDKAFEGCSEDLVVYCQKESYLWSRLKELNITTKEYEAQAELYQAGENSTKLKCIQEDINAEGKESVSDEDMMQLYGEPFFTLTEQGEILSPCCSLAEWADRELIFPKEATVIKSTFAQHRLSGMDIMIPKQITEIGEAGFLHCDVSTIEFEEGSQLRTIGRNAFMDEGISEIQLPEGVQEIGAYGFAWCRNLKEITIPKSVEKIGDYCFSLCTSLEKVTILNPETELEGDYIFDSTIIDDDLKELPNEKLVIYCQKGSNAAKYAKKHGLQVEYIK